MSVKQKIYTFKKMNKDIAESKTPEGFCYDANNIRFLTNQEVTSGAFSFEKGNAKVIEIPLVYLNKGNDPNSNKGTVVYGSKQLKYDNAEIKAMIPGSGRVSGKQEIIGHSFSRGSIIFFTTDGSGVDCIWKVDDTTLELTLLYVRNMQFNINNPIQAINNYENEIIDKIYWVDSKSQMRFINVENSIENGDAEELIDLPFNAILNSGTYRLSQPVITGYAFGGKHTSGMIQYAYNLYKVNGSSTKISPLNDLVSLDKGFPNGGGDVNDVVGKIPIVKVSNIDNNYTNIRLYAVKYTSYNQSPSVSLILDRSIIGLNEITYYDDGNIIESVSKEEFAFLGSDIIIPKHIQTKDNIMFLSNYYEKNFDVNTLGESNSIDTRAYSFGKNSTETYIYSGLKEVSGNIAQDGPKTKIDSNVINSNSPVISHKHSSLNINYDTYSRQYNSTVIGGEGPFIKYEIVRNRVGTAGFDIEKSRGQFLKDNEIYRLGIQFYNKYGQNSLPKWVADFKVITEEVAQVDRSNLNGYYASVKIELKPLFYTWLNNNSNFLDENGNYDEFLKPVGYKLLRANRELADRTILCQGLVNGMISQVNGDNTSDDGYMGTVIEPAAITRATNGLKLPSMMRRFDNYLNPMYGNKSYLRLDRHKPSYHPNLQAIPGKGEAGNEVFKAASSDDWTQGTYQFTQLMQMFSPEVEFNVIQNTDQVDFNLVGALVNNENSAWTQVRNIETKLSSKEIKVYDSISPFDKKSFLPGNFEVIKGNRGEIQEYGFFAHSGGEGMIFAQTFRKYTGNFLKSKNTITSPTYGSPVITEKGQGRTIYNNDNDYIYSNSLQPLSADKELSNVNSWGSRNITFALGPAASGMNLEQMHAISLVGNNGVGLIGEFRVKKNIVYLGNIYGGNTYESKKRSNYLEVGDYNVITNNAYNCVHFGDTFVQDFKFTKLSKTDTETYDKRSEQLTEIVEFRVETTVDLKNRNDLSLTPWDNRFQPKYDEYQKYNRVYSQQPTLFTRRDLDYKFKSVKGYDTNIIATKVKVPGEIIDSWTDMQPNNVLSLDGKFGPINGLIYSMDNVYAFQDKGIAVLSINPRVQVQGSDGISVELGTGEVLAGYKYISTSSGSINKWGILATDSGIYFLDALNKTFNVIGEGLIGLSDKEGFHKFFLDNINQDTIKIDNPLIYKGASIGWDKITNDIYLSIFDGDKKITLSYNLAQQGFSSFYDYNSSMYIFSKGKMRTINPMNNSSVWENFLGAYNSFYGENRPSSIEFIANPEPLADVTFNNLEYKSEARQNRIEIPNYTWERIKATNEFQNSNLVELLMRSNIRKLERKWRLNIPRNKGKVDRMKNTWINIRLEADNIKGYNYRNHDIMLYYNPNYKAIQ